MYVFMYVCIYFWMYIYINVCIADKLRYCLKKRVTIIHTAVGKHSLPVCASYHDRILFSGLQSFRIGVFEIGGISFTLN